MATNVCTITTIDQVTEFIQNDHYVRCGIDRCEIVQRPEIKTKSRPTVAFVDRKVIDQMVKEKTIKQTKTNFFGWDFFDDINFRLRQRATKIKPRLCKACNKMIVDPTQHNQRYHKLPACLAVQDAEYAQRAKDRKRLGLYSPGTRSRKKKVERVRVKCLGPADGTHYFMSCNPKTERICPLCKNLIAVRSGGLDDANGVVS